MVEKTINIEGLEFFQYEENSNVFLCNLSIGEIQCQIILEHFQHNWICFCRNYSYNLCSFSGDMDPKKENAVRSFKKNFVEHLNNLTDIKEELRLDYGQPDEYWGENEDEELCRCCDRVFLKEQLIDGKCDFCLKEYNDRSTS